MKTYFIVCVLTICMVSCGEDKSFVVNIDPNSIDGDRIYSITCGPIYADSAAEIEEQSKTYLIGYAHGELSLTNIDGDAPYESKEVDAGSFDEIERKIIKELNGIRENNMQFTGTKFQFGGTITMRRNNFSVSRVYEASQLSEMDESLMEIIQAVEALGR